MQDSKLSCRIWPVLPVLPALLVLLGTVGCPFGGDRGDRCSKHADCASDLVCASSKCAPPWGLSWRLSIERATFGPINPASGSPWDGDGLPDPYVEVDVDNQQLLRTTTRNDNATPTWTESVVIRLQNNTLVQMRLVDDNLLFDQVALETMNAPADIRELRQTDVTWFTTPRNVPDGGSVADRSVTLSYRWDVVE